jgi:hypothetical protein
VIETVSGASNWVEELGWFLAADPSRIALFGLGAAVGLPPVEAARERLLERLGGLFSSSRMPERHQPLLAAASLDLLCRNVSDVKEVATVVKLVSGPPGCQAAVHP